MQRHPSFSRPRRAAPPRPAAPQPQYLCFTVGSVPMAMDLLAVREVVEVPPLARIPRPAGPADSLAAVRGRVVLVVDLRKRLLNLVNPVTDGRARLIVTAGLARPWAFLVDAVTEILALEAEPPAAAATPASELRGELLAGSLEVRGTRVLVPDWAKVLAPPS